MGQPKYFEYCNPTPTFWNLLLERYLSKRHETEALQGHFAWLGEASPPFAQARGVAIEEVSTNGKGKNRKGRDHEITIFFGESNNAHIYGNFWGILHLVHCLDFFRRKKNMTPERWQILVRNLSHYFFCLGNPEVNLHFPLESLEGEQFKMIPINRSYCTCIYIEIAYVVVSQPCSTLFCSFFEGRTLLRWNPVIEWWSMCDVENNKNCFLTKPLPDTSAQSSLMWLGEFVQI